MIELVQAYDPGDTEDTWADYQYASAQRDLIEAASELADWNIGNTLTLLARSFRYARIAAKNRQEAARLRIVALVATADTEEEEQPCTN